MSNYRKAMQIIIEQTEAMDAFIKSEFFGKMEFSTYRMLRGM